LFLLEEYSTATKDEDKYRYRYLFAQVEQKKRLKVKNYGQEAEDGGEKKLVKTPKENIDKRKRN
jgi:hypothetical protein